MPNSLNLVHVPANNSDFKRRVQSFPIFSSWGGGGGGGGEGRFSILQFNFANSMMMAQERSYKTAIGSTISHVSAALV